MKLSVLRFLGRGDEPAPVDPAIPADISEQLTEARITFFDREEGLRGLFSLRGGKPNSWFHDEQTTAENLRLRFPELTDAQLARAVALVEGLVVKARRDLQMRIREQRLARQRGKSWINNY